MMNKNGIFQYMIKIKNNSLINCPLYLNEFYKYSVECLNFIQNFSEYLTT